MMEKRCADCVHFHREASFVDPPKKVDSRGRIIGETPVGECRAHTPRVNIGGDGMVGYGAVGWRLWPAVFTDDWCGEFATQQWVLVDDRK